MVSVSACHAEDPGSIPGRGVFRDRLCRFFNGRDDVFDEMLRVLHFNSLHARLAQSVERKALNLVVVGSSPTVGVDIGSGRVFFACALVLNGHTGD